jgi:hypothetical protein
MPEAGTVKDTKFTSFAYPWINKYIREHITRNKTMVSGGLAALYNNEAGFTISVDAFDDRGSDQAGSDHKWWLADTSCNVHEAIESKERMHDIKTLVREICSDLDITERTAIYLHFGIDTINGVHNDICRVAKMLEISHETAEMIIAGAFEKHAVDALMNPENVKTKNMDDDVIDTSEEVKSFVDKNYDIAQLALSGRCVKPDENGIVKKVDYINICKVDKASGKFWYEIRDNNNNIVENDIKHIDFLKGGTFNFKEGFATDLKGDRFIIEESSIDKMPDVYKKQWSVSTKPMNFTTEIKEPNELPSYMNTIVEEEEDEFINE